MPEYHSLTRAARKAETTRYLFTKTATLLGIVPASVDGQPVYSDRDVARIRRELGADATVTSAA